jgi:hypothetical protein
MHSIRDIISSLNDSICGLLPSGSELNGVAELVPRDDLTIPEIDGKFVGIDDRFPVRIYHRLNSVNSKISPGTGIGRSAGDQENTYSVSMVVFLQKERAKLYPDELLLIIQAGLPERLQENPYKSIVITFNGAQMDSQSNWKQEYAGGTEYKLKSDQFLFRINYSIETTFSKGCFKQCP